MDVLAELKIAKSSKKEFSVIKSLRKECTIAPIIFKVHLGRAVKEWKRKCREMRKLL